MIYLEKIIYTVINGKNVLQIGKSNPGNKGRLKKVFYGSIQSKHNKAFICGLYSILVDKKMNTLLLN